jgi:Ser/Thr protein kinase RdoA (MazF antagonist)
LLYRNIGKAVAGLHAALALYPYEIRSFVIDPYSGLYNLILPDLYAAGAACAAEAEILFALRGEMETALGNLPRQRIHGDCHDGNVCLENGRVSGFIDTDHLPLGPRLFDICEYLIHIIKWDAGDPFKTEAFLRLFPEFIRGYLEVVPLTDGEKHAIWHMLLYMQAAFYHYKIQNGWQDAPKDPEAFRWVYRNRSRIEERLRESGILGKNAANR